MARDNYYILLGLELHPPVSDAGLIKAALRAKKQEWTRWQEHPLKRHDGIRLLGEAKQIERVMLDPVLREKEAEAAVLIKSDMLKQFAAELRVLEAKGYILPKEESAIIVKYKDLGATKKLVESFAKCPITNTPPPDIDEGMGEILDRVAAKNIARGLKLLGFPTLYAFLREPQYSSVKKLQAAAEHLRRTSSAQGGKSPDATVAAELAGIAASLFESVAKKQRYDRYLKVSKYPAVGEILDEEAARSACVGPNALLRIVNFAVEVYGVKILEAEEYIKAYCKAYSIPLDARGAITPCPCCGAKTPVNGRVCAACGQPFSGVCPQCGEAFDSAAAICGTCGFKLGYMGKALGHIDEACDALIENDWLSAWKHLQYAEKFWPRHEKLEPLNRRALVARDRYDVYVGLVSEHLDNRKFYAAKSAIDEAGLRGIKLPSNLIKSVALELADFEKRMETLTQNGGIDDSKVEQLLKLSAQVTDSDELARLLATYPPQAPEELSAEIFESQVALSWGESKSAFTDEYMLVRKKNAHSLTAFDGDILYEGLSCSFTDTTAQPLVSYRYSLFSKRAGTYSRTAARSGAVMIVPDIKNLKILPMDSGARITWDFNLDIKEVCIWRKTKDGALDKNNCEQLPNDRLDGFSDSGLKNDSEYWYFIVAGYIADGVPASAKGVWGSVVPRKFIAPIEELVIAESGERGSYIVSWNAEAHSDILMFADSTRPDISEGDVFLAEDLLSRYRQLELSYTRAGSAGFDFRFSGGAFVFAAFVFGRFATVSEPRYIVSVPDISSPVCDIIDGSLHISMKWPAAVSDILIAHRPDHFPETPWEPGAALITCSRDQYDMNAAVIIGEPAPAKYYLTIFSEFTSPTGRKVLSTGVRLLVDNRPKRDVYYSFTYKKKRFSGTGALELSLSSDSEFVMPKAVITGRAGRLPLDRGDGVALFELKNSTIVAGSVSVHFETRPLPDGTYLRMFFDDEDMYRQLRLIPVPPVRI